VTLSTDQNPSSASTWGIPATIAWLLFAFLLGTVVATLAFGAFQGDRTNVRTLYDGVVITIGAFASVPVQIAVLSYAATLRRWTPTDYLALNRPKPAEIVFAVLCTIAFMMASDLMLFVSGRDLVPSYQIEAYQSAKDFGWLLGLLLAVIIVAPVGEEIAFRGFLYRGLVRPGYEKLTIVIIAIAWALLHIQYDWLGMVQIFAAGLLLGWVRWASRSTTLTIVMHVMINVEAMIETAIKAEGLL
jgi:membrane protease YdiL (CAAX protease family)